jgi:CHAT domain-containing protein
VNSALVIGGLRIPASLCESQGWTETNFIATLQEATMVAEMLTGKYLQVKPYLQQNATKEVVLSEINSAECIHFASPIAWKNPAIVLSSGSMLDSQPNSKRWTDLETEDENEIPSVEIPPMSDFMLSSDDLQSSKLNAKLVVLNSSSVDDITGSAVANFANSWLLCGVGAVLCSLWPVPETASKILLRAFYSALLQGSSVSHALSEAMQTVQHTKHFNNPINWAGFMLIGTNIRLSNKVALIGKLDFSTTFLVFL